MWSSGSVVSDWRGAEIVPIPKKGDLKSPDNWRGISIVFGELPGTHPRHGPKKRWCDVIAGDLVSRHVPLGKWYTLAQDRST